MNEFLTLHRNSCLVCETVPRDVIVERAQAAVPADPVDYPAWLGDWGLCALAAVAAQRDLARVAGDKRDAEEMIAARATASRLRADLEQARDETKTVRARLDTTQQHLAAETSARADRERSLAIAKRKLKMLRRVRPPIFDEAHLVKLLVGTQAQFIEHLTSPSTVIATTDELEIRRKLLDHLKGFAP